jgi:hypothetical protein
MTLIMFDEEYQRAKRTEAPFADYLSNSLLHRRLSASPPVSSSSIADNNSSALISSAVKSICQRNTGDVAKLALATMLKLLENIVNKGQWKKSIARSRIQMRQ